MAKVAVNSGAEQQVTQSKANQNIIASPSVAVVAGQDTAPPVFTRGNPETLDVTVCGRSMTIKYIDHNVLNDTLLSAVSDYHGHLGRSNMSLYTALSKVYNLYLHAAGGVPHHEDLANTLVKTYFTDENKGDNRANSFNICLEPEGNKFSILLRATVLNVKKVAGQNEPDLHIPQTSNMWSGALHWCLRQGFDEVKALEELTTHGIRACYSKEMQARQIGKQGGAESENSDKHVQSSITSVKSMTPLLTGNLKEQVVRSDTGLGVFLCKIDADEHGNQTIGLIDQLDASDAQLKSEAVSLVDKVGLDGAIAGPVIRLLRLSKHFIGNLNKCSNILRYDDNILRLYIGPSGDSDKPATHIVAQFVLDDYDLEKDGMHRLNTGHYERIMRIAGEYAGTTSWRFDRYDSVAAAEVGAGDYYLVVDVDDVPESFELISGTAAVADKSWMDNVDVCPEDLINISRSNWEQIIVFAATTQVLENKGTKEGVACGFELSKKRGSFLDFRSIGFSKNKSIRLDLGVESELQWKAEIKTGTLLRLVKLRALSTNGSVRIMYGENGLMFSVKGARADYSIFLKRETVKVPTKERKAKVK